MIVRVILRNKINTFKMAQNRSKPWTIVHGFGSISGHFGLLNKNALLTPTKQKTYLSPSELTL